MSHQKIEAPSIEETVAKISAAKAEAAAAEVQENEAEVRDDASEEAPEVAVEAAEEAVEQPEEAAEAEEAEAPSEEAKAIDDAISTRFAKLAEREREFRRMEQRFADQEERMNQRLQELEAREKKLSNPDTLLDTLNAMGLSVEDFQRRLLMNEINVDKPEVDPIQEKLQQLEERQQRLEEWENKMLAQERAAELKSLEDQYLGEVAEAAARYENLSEYFDGNVDEIVSAAHQQAELYAQQYGEAPEIDDLLSQLDNYYGSHLDRFRKKWAPPKQAEQVTAPASKKKPGKTLKNSDVQTAATTDAGGYTFMDVSTGRITMDQWQDYILKKRNLG